MRALRYIPLALLLVAVSAVVAHSDQGWQDNQDAAGFYLWDLPAPATLPAGIQPTAPLLYGGHAAASLVSNPNASTGVAIDVTLGNGLGFAFPAPGVNQLENASPLFALSAVTPLAFDSATNVLSAPGVLYTGGTPPVDLGTAVANSIVACSTSGSVCSPTGVVVAGGLHYASGTLTDAAFSCGSNQWVSSTSTGGPTCTQPAIGNMQSIGAHTIVANGTALAAPPAQTSIGTTMAFDGTGQLQDVGLRDGGGVNHVTTGTWPISSVIETDVSGNIAAEAQLTCGQSEGPWTGIVSKLAGSCSTGWQSIWPATANEILFSVGATSTPTADSRLAWDPANHTIVLSGQAAIGDTQPLGISTAGAVQVFPLNTISIPFHATWVPNTFGSSIKWMMTTSDTPSSGSQIGYAAGMLFKYWRLTVNTDNFSVTTGGYFFEVTKNGSSIGGASVSGLGASTSGGATSSASTTDSYGVRLNSSAASAGTNSNSVILELSQYPI